MRTSRHQEFGQSLDGGSKRTPHPSLSPPRGYLFTALPTLVVQQICSLLYRRFATCGSSAKSRGLGVTDAWPVTNRRYGRLKICGTVNRHPWGEGARRAGEGYGCMSKNLCAAIYKTRERSSGNCLQSPIRVSVDCHGGRITWAV